MNIKPIIERNDTTEGRAFDLIIQALIVLSLISFSVETLPNLGQQVRSWLSIVEIVTVVIFTVEYLLRIFVADRKFEFIFSFYGIVDLIAILPFYISTGVDLRSVRVVRLLRLFRAFKLIRYTKAIQRFGVAFRMIKEELYVFVIATLFLLFISSVGIYYFENAAQPDKFASVFHCMWWSIETLTTVGYGDIHPITTGGKVFTFFILMIGLGIIAVPTALIASALTTSIALEKDNSETPD
ncbi:MAG: ion transporter [Saprospiraceae bacterium]|nr:ion transporter [Saprospiraceae bacterium]